MLKNIANCSEIRTKVQVYTIQQNLGDNLKMRTTPALEECPVGGIETRRDLTEFVEMEISNYPKRTINKESKNEEKDN